MIAGARDIDILAAVFFAWNAEAHPSQVCRPRQEVVDRMTMYRVGVRSDPDPDPEQPGDDAEVVPHTPTGNTPPRSDSPLSENSMMRTLQRYPGQRLAIQAAIAGGYGQPPRPSMD